MCWDVPPCLGLVTVFEWAICIWLFLVGACVGSFLNVVMYRLPRGEPLAYPASRCPRCHQSIALRDNIPIVSWLVLRGRCRWCGGAISPRYPMVEALTATWFLALGVAVYVAGASHLPAPGLMSRSAWERLPSSATAPPAALVAYHAVLVSYLIVAAGIQYDGLRVPRRWTAFALLVGAGAPLVWPELRPVASMLQAARDAASAGIDAAAGVAVGGLLGLVMTPAVRWGSGPRGTAGDALSMLATLGAYVGWQTAIALSTLAAVVHVPLVWMCVARRGPCRWKWGCVVCGTTMIGILAWRPLLGDWWLESPVRTLATTAAGLAVIVLAVTLARCAACCRHAPAA
jgi:leader peptidase (prepilin peptidase)/N-methyltransferase